MAVASPGRGTGGTDEWETESPARRREPARTRPNDPRSRRRRPRRLGTPDQEAAVRLLLRPRKLPPFAHESAARCIEGMHRRPRRPLPPRRPQRHGVGTNSILDDPEAALPGRGPGHDFGPTSRNPDLRDSVERGHPAPRPEESGAMVDWSIRMATASSVRLSEHAPTGQNLISDAVSARCSGDTMQRCHAWCASGPEPAGDGRGRRRERSSGATSELRRPMRRTPRRHQRSGSCRSPRSPDHRRIGRDRAFERVAAFRWW